MTFREKLEKEHPDYVDDKFQGGCRECPYSYGYETWNDHKQPCADERFRVGECRCRACWNREIPEVDDATMEAMVEDLKNGVEESPHILDSGNRREFSTGAVRDIQEGKGRMDLLPWGAIMEVSKHCENGAKKYGEHNVDKGIPTHSLCDSAARHLAKYLDGWTDEPHLLAAAWNLLWALQMELKHKECVDTPWMKKEDNITSTQQE